MENKKKTSNAWVILILLTLFAFPIIVFMPFIALGLGEALDFVTPNSSKNQAQHFLEEKYKEDFVVEKMNESNLNGIYEGIAFVKDTNLILNLAGWKPQRTKELYIQDDYTLQLLLDEWIKENFKEKKVVFKAEYTYPDMFMAIQGGRMDWSKLLENRYKEKNIFIKLTVFVDENIDYSLEESMNNLKSKIERENIKLSNFTLVKVQAKNLNIKLLLLSQKERNEKVVDFISFENLKE